MKNLNCLSISYRTAPVNIRELFSCTGEERKIILTELIQEGLVTEGVILSTCNRTEFYYITEQNNSVEVQKRFAGLKQVDYEMAKKYYNVYCKDKALEHLYKVASGMDSMVLGEDEVLSQLKEAFFVARDLGVTGYFLNSIFQSAITCAKKIKTNTNLSKIPVSIGTLVANEVVKWSDEPKKVLILGVSGKMGSIVMKNLIGRPGITILGSSRKHKAFVQIVEPGVIPIDYYERYTVMDEADIIVSVTSSPHYTITYEELTCSLKSRKSRLFIDLSVPMDIDKEITKIDGVTLYDIDYFEQLSKENNEMKKQELVGAKDIMEEYLSDIRKTIEFHQFLTYMPRVKQVMKEQSLEKILYQLREKISAEEFITLLDALKKV